MLSGPAPKENVRGQWALCHRRIKAFSGEVGK